MEVFRAILKRFIEKFGPYLLKLIIGPIMLWLFMSLLMIIASYIECWHPVARGILCEVSHGPDTGWPVNLTSGL